jgi:hypothetical protein
VRLRATVTVEYDAHPGDYQTYDPEEAAAIDQVNWRSDPTLFFASFAPSEFKIAVEVCDVKPSPPVSQHVDDDPERSMQEDRVDV